MKLIVVEQIFWSYPFLNNVPLKLPPINDIFWGKKGYILAYKKKW